MTFVFGFEYCGLGNGSIHDRSNSLVLEMAPEFQTEFSNWEMDLNMISRPHWSVLHTNTTVISPESNCNYYQNDPKSRSRCPIAKWKIASITNKITPKNFNCLNWKLIDGRYRTDQPWVVRRALTHTYQTNLKLTIFSSDCVRFWSLFTCFL